MNILDLSTYTYDRIFVVGEVWGNYDILIRLLYEQGFNYKDLLVFTGNFLDLDNTDTLKIYEFLQSNTNCFAIKGKKENDIYVSIKNSNEDVLSKIERRFGYGYINKFQIFISNLPLISIIKDKYYIIHAGIIPTLSLFDQPEDVFYSIGHYSDDSRFYKYYNNLKSSWYENVIRVEGKRIEVCFSYTYTQNYKVPAGYNLGRVDDSIRCLIINSMYEDPTLVIAE